MTGHALNRQMMIAGIKVAAVANSDMGSDYDPSDWSLPEWELLSDRQISILHSLAHSRGLNLGTLDTVRVIMDDKWYSDGDLDALLVDMKRHLDNFWNETHHFDFADEESVPYFILRLTEFREWLPAEEKSLTQEQELIFLFLLPLVPAYLAVHHFGSIHHFIRERTLDEARTALALRGDDKVRWLREAESILDNGAQPLVEGYL